MRLVLYVLLFVANVAFAGNWNKAKKPQVPIIEYDRATYQIDSSLDGIIEAAISAPMNLEGFAKVELESLYRPVRETFHVYQKLQPVKSKNVVVNHHAGGIGEHTIFAAHYFYAAGFNVFVTDSITGRGFFDNGSASLNEPRLSSLQRVADSAKTIIYIRELSKTQGLVNSEIIHWYGHSGYGAEGAFALSRPGVRLYYSPSDPDRLRLTSAALMYPWCNAPRLGGAPDTPLLIIAGEHDQENLPEYCVKNFGGSDVSKVIIIPATHGWSIANPRNDGQQSFAAKTAQSYCDELRTAQGNIVLEDGRLVNVRRVPEYFKGLRDNGCINQGYWSIRDWHLTRWTLEQSLKHMAASEGIEPRQPEYDLLPEIATNHYRTSEWQTLSEYPDAVCTNGRPAGYYSTSTPFGDARKVALMFGGSPYALPENGASVGGLVNKHTDVWAKEQVTGWSLHGAFGDLIDNGWKIIVVPNCVVDSWIGDSTMKYSASKFHLRGRAIVRSTLNDLQKKAVLTDETQLMFLGVANGIVALTANRDLFTNVPRKKLTVVADGVIFPDPIYTNFRALLKQVPGRSWYQSLFKGNPNCEDSPEKCLSTPNNLFSITNSENVFFTFQQDHAALNVQGVDLPAEHYLKQMNNASGLLSTGRWGDSPWATTLWGFDYGLHKRGVGSVKEAFRSWLVGQQMVVVDD